MEKTSSKIPKSAINRFESLSILLTNWIGTPVSILVHTLLFVGIFALKFIGFNLDSILLILTTAVSLEAIYLAIFIQMTVNRTHTDLGEVAEDVEDLEEDAREDDQVDDNLIKSIKSIESKLNSVQADLSTLRRKGLI
jgi:low affinity Fe/Cu permease